MILTKQNSVKGGLIYLLGDLFASYISDEVSWHRILGMLFIGATLYAIEIPIYFAWIDKITSKFKGVKLSIIKTFLAIAFFNPLWITRHFIIILIISNKIDEINFSLLNIALMSFLVNIPISFIANFIIQNKIKLEGRFIASAVFSGLMAVYYAMSINWFA